MKIKSMMIAAMVAVIGMASCAKDGETAKTENGNPAEISIKFKNKNTNTRAYDDFSNAEKDQQDGILLNGGTIFVFDAAGKKIFAQDYTDTELQSKVTIDHTDGIKTTNVSRLILVGNVSDDIVTDIENVSDLRKVIKTLDDVADELEAATPNIWVYGEVNSFSWSAKDEDGVQKASVTMELHPIMTRIDVTVDITGVTAGMEAVNPAVVLDGVAMLYSSSHTTLIAPFTPSIAELAAFDAAALPLYSGLINSDYPRWTSDEMSDKVSQFGTAGDQTILFADWDGTRNGDNLDAAEKVFTRTFYALAPDFAKYGRNAILTIFGTHFGYDDDDAVISDQSVFWTVHFSGDESAANAEVMEAGKRYEVKIKMKGDFSNGDGDDDPETTENKGQLDITILEPTWVIADLIEKTFEPEN